MTVGVGAVPPVGASKTTTEVMVPSERTAAIRDPSGDQVGKPYLPSDVSSTSVEVPSASMTEIEPSSARTAIEPVDPIGALEVDAAGTGLDAPLADGEEAAVTDGAALGEGVGVPQAAASNTLTEITRTGRARATIR
jgi:hypothetical protein